jgi:hypothetical protein
MSPDPVGWYVKRNRWYWLPGWNIVDGMKGARDFMFWWGYIRYRRFYVAV